MKKESMTPAEAADALYKLIPRRITVDMLSDYGIEGAEAQEEDGEVFADKMARLTAQLAGQFVESAKLEGEIKKNLAGLGYV